MSSPTSPQPASQQSSPGQPYPGQQTYPGQPSGPAPTPPPPPTSTLAIVALVAAFVAPIVGLVLGIVARRRIRRTGEKGRGLATTAIVLGALFSLAWIATLVAVLTLSGTVTTSVSGTPSVPASSVESQIVAQAGLPAGSVTCPDPLPAQVGASTTCTADNGGQTTTIVATVTSVNGDDVGFNFATR